jgi:hypothetical protein
MARKGKVNLEQDIVVIVPGLPVDYKVVDDIVLISPQMADKIIEEES